MWWLHISEGFLHKHWHRRHFSRANLPGKLLLVLFAVTTARDLAEAPDECPHDGGRDEARRVRVLVVRALVIGVVSGEAHPLEFLEEVNRGCSENVAHERVHDLGGRAENGAVVGRGEQV